MSNIQVSIVKGVYRGKIISGVYPLVKGFVDGARGGFITIKNANFEVGTPMVQRVQVESDAFKLLDETGADLPAHIMVPGSSKVLVATGQGATDFETVFMESETEEEAMERISETFLMLDKITDACSNGTVRGLVVSGPPGIGKSFGVEKQLAAANMFRTLNGKDPLFEVISGGVSPIGLYQKLYHNRGADHVVVFDDCDGVLFEEECLNLLKAALNSGDKRRICWNKESRVLANDDIPESFDFEGSIIFLSNIDFDRSIAKGSRIAAHLAAIMSRCHYLDLEIGSMRDKLLRIKQIVRDGMLAPFNFSPQQEADVVAFVMDNAEYLREVSLRMVKKVADFMKADPVGWYEMAEATCLTKEAKFKRLYEKKQKLSESKGLVLI
jgi:hypothetical protein